MISLYDDDGFTTSIFLRPHDEAVRLIVNPHRFVSRGDLGFERQKPVNGFRIAPMNPAKRPISAKRRRRS
jgi:hypothetical protein